MLAEGIFGLLSAAPSLVALQAARVYPVLLPENPTLPATTYQIVAGVSTPTFETSGMQRMRVQFGHIATTYLASEQLRNKTRGVLDGFYGLMPNGLFIQNCNFIQPIDHFDNDARLYRCSAEYYFFFTLPTVS